MAEDNKNEGEGSRTAAHTYNEATRAFIRKGEVAERAEEAKQAVEGNEAEPLAEAESAGRAHAKEEDPNLRRDYAKPD